MMSTAVPAIEYRLSAEAAEHSCPLCGASFHAGPGIIPVLAGTSEPLCSSPGCAAEEEVECARPCSCRFEFADLDPATIRAIRSTPEHLDVAERFRLASLDGALPERDTALLQCAAIDLQFCEADGTRIQAWEPRLIVETCGDAAAELLLSGCGELV